MMTIDLEQKFGPFVHMAPGDVAIWKRWLEGEGALFAPYVYDVRVGDGAPLPAGSTSMEIAIRDALTRKRIDAVSITPRLVHIFEVKPRAGLSAIGQLVGYKQLYKPLLTSGQETRLWIITDKLQHDMAVVLAANAVRAVELPAPEGES